VNDIELGQRLARRLDACVDDIDPRVLRRLEMARERALDQLREPATALSTTDLAAGGAAGRLTGSSPLHHFPSRLLFPMAVLVAGLAVIYVWQGPGNGSDGEELELLGDELPINAYLDKGFQQWISPAMQR
jgi:hypothetical protein